MDGSDRAVTAVSKKLLRLVLPILPLHHPLQNQRFPLSKFQRPTPNSIQYFLLKSQLKMYPSEKSLILQISTTPNNTDKSTDWPTTLDKAPVDRPWHRKRVCCGFCAASLAVVAIVVLVVSFTVYKVREPTMRVNSINFNNLDSTKNLTVIADVSVKNPNALPFKFNSCTTTLLYRSKNVGSAYGPPGAVGAHKTLRTNVTVNVISSRLLADPNFMGDVQNGSLALQTSTMVGGKVTILGMFRRHVDVMMNCTVSVAVGSQAILDQSCTQRMWM